MMAQAGVNPAEAGVVAERFSAQARFLETTVIQQLQEKKAIEFLHGQLMATRALVNSLEQHHDLQSQQIEANLQKALAVYEQAIALRHQQNLLQNVISTLRRDKSTLRKAAGLPAEHDPATGSSPSNAAHMKPPSLDDLLPPRSTHHAPSTAGLRSTTAILTEHSLTAHQGDLAAAGLAGPGAMGMWMNHAAAGVAGQPATSRPPLRADAGLDVLAIAARKHSD